MVGLADPAFGLIDRTQKAVINSNTERNSYMRFTRRFSAHKASKLYPELVERFNDPAKRAALFLDWFKGHENLQEVQLVHKRRLLSENKSTNSYHKLTKKALLEHFHQGVDYVELVIQNCKKKKLFSKDPIDPDEAYWKYWVLKEEVFSMSKALQVETEMESGPYA